MENSGKNVWGYVMNTQPIDVLAQFGELILGLLKPIAAFLLSFLPNGDAQVYGLIDSFGNIGAGSTFDVFYFIDFGAVMVCFGVLITTMIVCTILKLMTKSIDIADRAIEKIPIVE